LDKLEIFTQPCFRESAADDTFSPYTVVPAMLTNPGGTSHPPSTNRTAWTCTVRKQLVKNKSNQLQMTMNICHHKHLNKGLLTVNWPYDGPWNLIWLHKVTSWIHQLDLGARHAILIVIIEINQSFYLSLI
jgi:hypothetical protein